MTYLASNLRDVATVRASVLISRSINHCSHAEAVRLSFGRAAFDKRRAVCGVRRIVKGIFVSGISFDHLHCHTMSAISDGVKCQERGHIVPDRKQPPRAIAAPEPCYIKIRLEPHGPYLPARINRNLGLLTANIDGVPTDVETVWASGDLITEAEWLDLIRDRSRAKPF